MNRFDFYYRQKVGEADLDALQDNIEAAIANLVKDVYRHGWIIGANLQPSSGMTVEVTAGVGYNENGERIYIGTTQTVNLNSYKPTSSGREAWCLIAARFKRVASNPRTDGHGNTVYYRQDEGFEIVVRKGMEASTGSATKPNAQAGDLIIGYVRVYYGQSSVTSQDISTEGRPVISAPGDLYAMLQAHIGSGGSAHAVATSSQAGFMSAADKAKLDSIATGAEVNQNAFSTIQIQNSSGSAKATHTADAKQDTYALREGGGITITAPADDVAQIAHADTSSQASVTNSGATVIQSVALDGYGHVTSLSSVQITPALIGAAAATHYHSAADITSGTISVDRLPSASTTAKGIVQLSTATDSTSTTMAATPSAVKAAYDLAASKANASHTHSASDITSGTIAAARLPSASTSAPGIVQLSTATNSTSTTMAATPSAVKAAYDLAASKADASHTHSAADITSGTISAARLPSASTSAPGIVQLTASRTSTSTSLALTASAMYDHINSGDHDSRYYTKSQVDSLINGVMDDYWVQPGTSVLFVTLLTSAKSIPTSSEEGGRPIIIFIPRVRGLYRVTLEVYQTIGEFWLATTAQDEIDLGYGKGSAYPYLGWNPLVAYLSNWVSASYSSTWTQLTIDMGAPIFPGQPLYLFARVSSGQMRNVKLYGTFSKQPSMKNTVVAREVQ